MASLDRTLLSAAVIALGLTLGGFAVGNGFARARSADRYVTVKGVAEREVRANLAIWPLRVVGADNDLTAANAKVAKNLAGVREFLVRHGVDTTQVPARRVHGARRVGQRVRAGAHAGEPVHRAADDARALESAGQGAGGEPAGERAGGDRRRRVVGRERRDRAAGRRSCSPGSNQLKPAMIADATARAREAAAQFARDSRQPSSAGIRQANQGVFEILPRDQAPGISEESQIAKTVRVVSTIDYYLR